IIVAESAPGAGDGGSIVIEAQFEDNATTGTGIEQISFDDGTVYDVAQIAAFVLQAQASDLDDTLNGSAGDDVLEGKGGDDSLFGAKGNDTYIYTRGDGFDLIEENDSDYGSMNRLVLHNILASEVIVREGRFNDLELQILETAPGAGNAGHITVRNSFVDNLFRGLDEIVFDDGTAWASADFETLAQRNFATPGDDRLEGTTGPDDFNGGLGNDLLIGDTGDDTYHYARGDGADVIREAGSGLDRIEISGYAANEISFARQGRDGIDLIIRLADTTDSITVVNGLSGSSSGKVEEIVLTDSGEIFTIADIERVVVLGTATPGDDLIIGSAADDFVEGGAGSDLLVGGTGDDTYTYRAGDGDDRISDGAFSTADRLILPDTNSDGLQWAKRSPANGDDLVLRFTGPTDRLHLADTLGGSAAGIEFIEFADGVVWTLSQMRAAVLDYAGTSGDERIRGFDSSDILEGRAGDDWMIGGLGGDTYRFRKGDGHDTIDDQSQSANDRLELTNLSSLEASVTRLYKGSDTVVMRFASSDDTITLRGLLATDGSGVEEIAFSDGVTWTRSEVLALLDNRAPVAVEDGIFTARRAEPLVLSPTQLLRNDFDPDGAALQIISVDGGEHGSAQIDGNGNIVFTGAEGFVGSTTFTYSVTDGQNGIATGTVSIRVVPPANAKDDFDFEVEEDGFLTIESLRLLSNDEQGDQMIVSQVFDAVGGAVNLASNGEISFTPAANFNGLASFKYAANTPEGGRAEATVYINVLPVNDLPVAGDDGGYEFEENAGLVINGYELLLNDNDIDGQRLTILSVTGDGNIIAELSANNEILVSAAPYYSGPGSFDYLVSDGAGGTATATVSVNVIGINNAPEAAYDTLSTNEDVPLLTAGIDLLANDTDGDGDPLQISSVRSGFGGSVTLNPNQTVLFTPTNNFFGQAHYFYTVSDGQGGEAEARVNIAVSSVNDAPNANNDSYASADVFYLDGVQDTALVIDIANLLSNDGDIDSLTIDLVSISFSDNGLAQIVGDTIVFTPDTGYWGEATFRYVIADTEGLVDDALVTMYFEPTGEAPPVAAPDAVTIFEDVETVIPASVLLGNDFDLDGDILEIVSVSMGLGQKGSVRLNVDGDIVFTPALNHNGQSLFTYTVTDNSEGEDTAAVTVNITPVNDAPTAALDVGATSLDVPLVLR
ncbi:MAG: tandem-95 repeat protein, partial [Rhodobiaceae bacterium]|nr:tandem-95 repeat protein [Rhodobiaceae bacterium]